MPTLTQYQTDALVVPRTRLNPDDPGNHAAAETKAQRLSEHFPQWEDDMAYWD